MGAVLEPIVILAMPRSGSSMISGIFHLHGCWVGRCREPDRLNPKGYFENLDIKDILIRRFGRLAQTVKPAIRQAGFRAEVEKLDPKPPWAVKHSAMYRDAWHEFRPKFICVRRRTEGIVMSNQKTRFLGTDDRERMLQIILAHDTQMDLGGVDVYPDEIINGDYASLKRAIDYCDLEFNERVVRDFVDPEHWHYGDHRQAGG